MLPLTTPTPISNLIYPAPRQAPPTTTASSSFSDLFPTGKASTAQSTSTTSAGASTGASGGAQSGPSLYLIIFLSILVLLLLTSLLIALRAIRLRRRFRTEIQRAIARGELPAWQAEELRRRHDEDVYGLGRLAGWGVGGAGWDLQTLLALGEGGAPGGPGGRRGKGRDIGKMPRLWDYEVVEGGVDGSGVGEDDDGVLSGRGGKEKWPAEAEEPSSQSPLSQHQPKPSQHPLAFIQPLSLLSLSQPPPSTDPPSDLPPPIPQPQPFFPPGGGRHSNFYPPGGGRGNLPPAPSSSFVPPGGGRGGGGRIASPTRHPHRASLTTSLSAPLADPTISHLPANPSQPSQPQGSSSLPLSPGDRLSLSLLIRMPRREPDRAELERRWRDGEDMDLVRMGEGLGSLEVGVWEGVVEGAEGGLRGPEDSTGDEAETQRGRGA